MRKFPCLLFLSIITVNAIAQNGAPYWSLAGNNNATTSSRLGTTNAVPLYLTTSNASRIYIAPDGKVGIGTTTPTSLFNVQGPTLLSIFTSTDALGPQSGSGIIGYTKFMPTAAGQRLGYFLTGSQNNGVDPGNGTGMVGYSDGAWSSTSRPSYLTFETAKTGSRVRSEAMRITSDGKIGIGTNTPAGRLHAADSATAIYAQGIGQGSIAVYATTNGGTGVVGSGVEGVYGSGGVTGVLGSGGTYGVYGNGPNGVYGYSPSVSGDGVYGQAIETNGYGGNFHSVKSYGILAGTSVSGGYAAYFQGSLFSTGSYNGSDRKLKKNIAEFNDAVSIINKLKPKTYEYLTEGAMAEMNLPKGKHYGLIAQDLETVLPDLVKETTQFAPHTIDSTGKKERTAAIDATMQTFKAVNYTELIPILIKGMQEQDADKEELNQKVQQQDEKMIQMQAEIETLKAMLSNKSIGQLSSASLEVPVPNPAKGSTNIRYNVPAGTASARITVATMLGQVMKEVKLSGGPGQVNLNVSNLSSGTYPCTLWLNGQPAVSKQLLIVH